MNPDVWKTHCRHMAQATQALADWCDDVDMLRAYVELAVKWIKMGEGPPPADECAHGAELGETRPAYDARG